MASAESDFKTAEGTLTAARNRLRVIIGRTQEEVDRLERERVVNPLITINAPIDGTVIARKVGPGQYVRSDVGDPLYTIADLSTMWLKANVPEVDIPLVRVGQAIEVKVNALPNRVFDARIIAIGAASDAVDAPRGGALGNSESVIARSSPRCSRPSRSRSAMASRRPPFRSTP